MIETDSQTKPFYQRWLRAFLYPIAATLLALGSYSDAILLITDFSHFVQSRYSNTLEYNQLKRIKVGNTLEYIEDIIGPAKASKTLNEEMTALYYPQEKYYLTIYAIRDRVSAYVVIPTQPKFFPEIPWLPKKTFAENTFENIITAPDDYSPEYARTNRYYIESYDPGYEGLFIKSYIGAVAYGNTPVDEDLLRKIYDTMILDEDEIQLHQLVSSFRSSTSPNFYGEGELPIAQIEKGLMSNGEYRMYYQR